MKVVSAQQMAHLESLAFHDGASESEFMEEAGAGIALIVHDYVENHDMDKYVLLLCGKGNNAGDAYVAGCHLLDLGYEVHALQLVPISQCSPLCQGNHHRFVTTGGMVREAGHAHEIAFPSHGIIVDGIFGTGFKGQVKEPFDAIIALANKSKLPIIAVDIPSGLNGTTGQVEGECIRATETGFLGLPKTGFFLRDAWNYVGKLRYVDFGLAADYIEDFDAEMVMIDSELVKPMLPEIKRNQHKYERGLVVGLTGSPGMPGAAILSTLSALSAGAGIVRLLHPDGMQAELSASPEEIIKVAYKPHDFDGILLELNKAAACFVGPGIGRTESTLEMLQYVLPRIEVPCVVDADALTLLAGHSMKLPSRTLLTPHHGEMQRLLGKKEHVVVDATFLKECGEYAKAHQVTLVLKGGPTFVLEEGFPYFVNSSGDPGMATAGSGDVLTGMLAALLAQKLSPLDAARLGVYLHGLAGEHAALELTSYCMLASDIIQHFPEAFSFRLL